MSTEFHWRPSQTEWRDRWLAKYNSEEVERYEAWMQQLTSEDDAACLSDIARVFGFPEKATVLDAGAGTGAMTRMLSAVPGLVINALEPAPAMLAKLRSKPELSHVATVEAFCDSHDDQQLFAANTFDVIISRQLVSGLFDPLAAFRNWHHWLKPDGSVIVMDGLYDRDSWTGRWADELDVLPLSACRTMAMVPYLLEMAGFQISAVESMASTNALPSTRTERYVVVAVKH